MTTSHRRRAFARAALLTMLALPFAAAAQEATPPAQPAPAAAGEETEEIIVTARKRAEDIQDVPFAVSAQTEEQLRSSGSRTLEDIALNVPSLSVQNLGPGQSQVAMRGISAGQVARDLPGVKEQVGIYLDESVVSLSLFTPDLDLFDLNRVEVLRGPQGTLFGSGSVSGTVRYITNQPNLEEIEAIGEAGINFVQDGGRGGEAKGAINYPIIEGVLGARLVGYWTRFPGFIDARTPSGKDDDVNEGDRWGFRLSFLWQPSDSVRITPRVIYQDVSVDGFNRQDRFNILANEFTTTRPTVDLGKREQFRQLEEEFTDEFMLADLTAAFDLTDWLTLTSISSYTDRDILMLRDATQLTASITGGTMGQAESIYTLDAPLYDATDVQVFTQELRLSGSHEIGAGLDWVFGFFYSDIDRDYGQSLPVTGYTAAGGVVDDFPHLVGTDVLFFSDIPYDFKQKALFGEVTWSPIEVLHLTAGLRWFDFEEDRSLNFDGLFADQTIDNVQFDPNTDLPIGVVEDEANADGYNPRFIVSLTPNENLEFSLQASKGFRLGGINDPLNRPLCSATDLQTFGGFETFKDETVWNYEAGAKTRWADGRVTANAAVFYADIEDLQATLEAGTCSSRIVFNVPKARAVGVEAELAFQPIDQLDLAVSFNYTDAELRSTVTSTTSPPPPALPVTSVVAGIEKGKRLPTIPEFQISAAATYTQPSLINELDGFATLSYQHVGSRWTQIPDQADGFLDPVTLFDEIGAPVTDPANPPPAPQALTFDPKMSAYDLLNARIGLRSEKWEVAFFINNLTDERAELALDRERGGAARVGFLTNQPRTFGFTTRIVY